MRPMRVWHTTLGLLLLFTATTGYATPPPPEGEPLPEAYQQRIDEDPEAFTVDNAVDRIEQVLVNRAAAIAQDRALDEEKEVEKVGGISIKGERVLPVIPVKFQRMADPFPISDLQQALFGDLPGTLTDYYREVSYGLLHVRGDVVPWQELSHDDTFYEGADFQDGGIPRRCKGLCSNARIGDLIKEALDAADPLIDFSQMDLTGPRGEPDGFVDAVAFIHPERGGECRGERSNIWSHQGVYRRAMKTTEAYTTQDKGKNGDLLKIDTFLIVPARDCELPGVNRIGVFAHEFAHTLGLPDLYDTDSSNGTLDSVGNWCLMSTGTYGGDGQSPERPVHPSAWAKAQLGWLFPDQVKNEPRYQPARISESEDAPLAYQLQISPNEYYLVENRQRRGYDSGLPGDGLMIWRIRRDIAENGIRNNTVNADSAKGVSLEQADGDNAINGGDQRGDGGDPFPGESENRGFFRGANPSSRKKTAVCEISDSGPSMSARLFVTTDTCTVVPQPSPAAPAPPAPEPDATGAPAQAVELPSLKDLSAHPEEYLNRKVRLIGKLVNLGTNYFTDRRIAFQDAEGNTVAVQPWLPLEVPPGDQPGLPTLAMYLDKNVEIVGEVKLMSREGEKGAFLLNVDSAEVIPPKQ